MRNGRLVEEVGRYLSGEADMVVGLMCRIFARGVECE